jgi:dienelactone hydrolase
LIPLVLTAAFVAALHADAFAQTRDVARVRAAFLQMIDRPRVPLAPVAHVRSDAAPYRAEDFSFASESGERVPGIFFKAAAAKDRLPLVVFLHGTGSRKEEFLALMRTFADRGFATASIDGRHHGARISARYGSDNEQYYAAMLDAYRTGKGRPYLYDTVWDVMRLIDYLETRPDVDPARIGIMGISKGGSEAYLATAVDPRIAAAVPIIAVQGYRWALDNDQWQARVSTFAPPVDRAARDEGVAVDAAFVRRFYDRVAPGIYGDYDAGTMLALAAPRPVLVINGDSDGRTPLPGVLEAVATARGTYQRVGADEKLGLYLQPNAGHVFTRVAELVMTDWFAKWLRPSALIR